ncbi:AAA family ATPase [Myxococcota bacterium]
MPNTEFCMGKRPIPRRGFTSIEAAEFLRMEFPDVKEWTCWLAEMAEYSLSLSMFITTEDGDSGTVANWKWTRVPTSYPDMSYWCCDIKTRPSEDGWVGAIHVEGPERESFLLFSCLCSNGSVGSKYYASTKDRKLLDRFARDVHKALTSEDDGIRVRVMGGRDIIVPFEEDVPLFLPDNLLEDITRQAFSFFEGKDLYKRLSIRHRRGFLIVGPPGNGKTMMVRRLIRMCHEKFEPDVWALAISKQIDEYELDALFSASSRGGRGMVILEDLDSLIMETKVTRAGLLSRLDGLEPREGLLVVATTNNPQDVDPALLHRPSRFDRVWRFSLPDLDLRTRYLEWALTGMDLAVVGELARATQDWSFAYLNELRVTAAILAIQERRGGVTEADVRKAYELLSAQFKSGTKNHQVEESGKSVGFAA